MKFDERLNEKITRGDNWRIVSKPFFIHHDFNFINL